MNFLNQALLWGGLAVSIPIIIHLLNRRRFRKVPWAAMRFLNVSVEQNQRRMKLEDYILLALRCALLALLAFAIARPVVEGLRGLPGSKVAAAVVVDNSASMRTVAGDDTTRLDLARKAAAAVVDGVPPGSSVAVSTPFAAGEPTTEAALARRRVEEIAPTDRHADLLTAVADAARKLDGQSAAEKELYLVTDAHAEEWSAYASLAEKLGEVAAGTTVHLVLVGSPATTNLAVTRLEPSGSLPSVNQPFRLDVDVANFGVVLALDVPVTLFINDQAVEDPWVIDEIKPGRSETATFYATLPAAGYHRVTVGVNRDEVPFDDRRTLVLRAVDDVRVLLVDGDPGDGPRDAETFFLRHALAPVPEEARDAYPVKPAVVSLPSLANESLDDYDAVVLANVPDLSPPMANRLAQFVEAGGGLVVFPGENVRKEFYNSLLHAKHDLLPATFVSSRDDDAVDLALEAPETNPLGLPGDILSTASFRQTWTLGDRREASRVALRFSDGSPALLESDHGLGKVYLFTSTADTAWSDFAVKPAFVPFVNRLLGGIVQHRDRSLNLQAGETLVHRLPARHAGKEATVYEVDDPEALGRLTAIGSGNAPVLRFEGADRAGAYQAAIAGEGTPVVFAAQPNVRESSLALLEPSQLEGLSDSATVIRWDGGAGAKDFGSGRRGSELWLPLLFLVIAIAALEMALAQWFSRSK